jgi:NAD(P)-dependent dehydrogenase (short-subunit alcohol dehydrogenase family)
LEKTLTGKVCLVTGATSGIGKVTAATLASMGATVVITGRRQPRISSALQELRAQTGNENIHALQADFSDLKSVKALAESFLASFDRLNILVNNAGSYYNRRYMALQEVERTFLVNHLAPFLLTGLLLNTIKSSAPARIVNVSSGAHIYDTMDFNNLGFQNGYIGLKAYARSKLANILFTYELARRLGDSGVTANAVHPGQVATDIWRTNFFIIGPVLKWMVGLKGLTPEQGADPLIFLACSPEVEKLNGKYFNRRKIAQSSPITYDEEIALRLWNVSERLTGVSYP